MFTAFFSMGLIIMFTYLLMQAFPYPIMPMLKIIVVVDILVNMGIYAWISLGSEYLYILSMLEELEIRENIWSTEESCCYLIFRISHQLLLLYLVY